MGREKDSRDKRTIKLNPFYVSPNVEPEFERSNENHHDFKDDTSFKIKTQKKHDKKSKNERLVDLHYKRFKENQAKAKLLKAKYELEIKTEKIQNSPISNQKYRKKHSHPIRLRNYDLNKKKPIYKSTLPLICEFCGMRMSVITINNIKYFECSTCDIKEEIDINTEKSLKLKTKIPHLEEKVEIVNTEEIKEWNSYMEDISLKMKSGSLEEWKKNQTLNSEYLTRTKKPSQTKNNFNKSNAKFLKEITQNNIIIGKRKYIAKIDDSAMKKEIQRTPIILGNNYKDFFITEIKKREKKYLIFKMNGRHEFISHSKYGDRTYTAFNVNREIKEPVFDFLPEIIERKKKELIEHEFNRYYGNLFYYTSPAGRYISRNIKPTKRDFIITLKSVLSVSEPQSNMVQSLLNKNIKKNLIIVNDTERMCVKCSRIFTPISWSDWEDKYLSTSQVYVCENCNPILRKIISKERKDRDNFKGSIKNLESKKLKFNKLSYGDLTIILIAVLIGIGFSSLLLLLLLTAIPSLIGLFIFFRFKIKSITKTIDKKYSKESNRQKMVLNSVDKFILKS